MSTAAGYKSDPLSSKLEELIEARLVFLRAELRIAQTGGSDFATIQKVFHLEGNIGSLVWVLREADLVKRNLI